MAGRQREHTNEMIGLMERFEWDMHRTVGRQGCLPPEWHEIWQARGAPKNRVTLRLDRDVVRFFKSMGDGYGPRMNAILRSFMLARLAGLIEHGDLAEKYREKWQEKPRPGTEQTRKDDERLRANMAETGALSEKANDLSKRGEWLSAEDRERLRVLGEELDGLQG